MTWQWLYIVPSWSKHRVVRHNRWASVAISPQSRNHVIRGATTISQLIPHFTQLTMLAVIIFPRLSLYRSSCSSHVATLSIFYYLKLHNRVTRGASTISQLTPHFAHLTAVNMADIFPHQSLYLAFYAHIAMIYFSFCHIKQYENDYLIFKRRKCVNINIKMWKCVHNGIFS